MHLMCSFKNNLMPSHCLVNSIAISIFILFEHLHNYFRNVSMVSVITVDNFICYWAFQICIYRHQKKDLKWVVTWAAWGSCRLLEGNISLSERFSSCSMTCCCCWYAWGLCCPRYNGGPCICPCICPCIPPWPLGILDATPLRTAGGIGVGALSLDWLSRDFVRTWNWIYISLSALVVTNRSGDVDRYLL